MVFHRADRLFVDFDFLVVVKIQTAADSNCFSNARFCNFAECVRYQSFDQSRIYGRNKESYDVFVELAGSIELSHAAGFHVKVGDPVGSLTLPVDWVSQFAFFPQPTCEDFATEALDELL